MGVTPNTSIAGQVLKSRGTGQNDSVWSSDAVTISIGFSIVGPVIAYTFPGFTIPVPNGQTVSLIAVIGQTSAGTIDVECLQNGSGIAGLTAVSLTSSSSGYVNPTTNPTAVADQDYFQITTSSPSSMGDLSFDFVFEIS